jgi:hypothetical protein
MKILLGLLLAVFGIGVFTARPVSYLNSLSFRKITIIISIIVLHSRAHGLDSSIKHEFLQPASRNEERSARLL